MTAIAVESVLERAEEMLHDNQANEPRKPPQKARKCRHCQTEFIPNSGKQRYCTTSHRVAAFNARKRSSQIDPIRKAVLERDDHRCRVCECTEGDQGKTTIVKLVVRQVVAGARSIDTCVVLCSSCNGRASAQTFSRRTGESLLKYRKRRQKAADNEHRIIVALAANMRGFFQGFGYGEKRGIKHNY